MAVPPSVASALALLRHRLTRAQYTQASLQRRLGIVHPDDVGILNQEPTRLRLRDDTSNLSTAAQLFFLEAQVPQASADRLLSPSGVDQLKQFGLLRSRSGKVSARLRIEAIGEQLFLADNRFRNGDPTALGLHTSARHRQTPRIDAPKKLDPVYPPSSDSILLREAVAPAGSGRVLDLCTGSGVQAVSQAAYAQQIAAVDINPRAVAVAQWNVALNRAANVEVHLGDLYDTVKGQCFDTIIANPPFVSSPYAQGPSYHAGGPTGDMLLRRILGGFGKHLAANGRGFAITHVGLHRGQQLADLGRTWMRGFPGRTLVLELESGSAVDLAAAQALFAIEQGVAAYAREVRRWVDYLRKHRIERIAAVLVVAEKTGTASLEVVDARPRVFPMPLTPPPAQQVASWFANR